MTGLVLCSVRHLLLTIFKLCILVAGSFLLVAVVWWGHVCGSAVSNVRSVSGLWM